MLCRSLRLHSLENFNEKQYCGPAQREFEATIRSKRNPSAPTPQTAQTRVLRMDQMHVLQQRHGLSTGLASSVSSSRTATLTRSWKATQTQEMHVCSHCMISGNHRQISAASLSHGMLCSMLRAVFEFRSRPVQ